MVVLVALVVFATQSVAQDSTRIENLSLSNWEVDVTRDLFGVREILSTTQGEYAYAPGAQSSSPSPVFFVLCSFNQHKPPYINIGVGIPGIFFEVQDKSCATGAEEFLEVASFASQAIGMVKDAKEDRFMHHHRFFYRANPRTCGKLNWKKQKMHEFGAAHEDGWTWLINRDNKYGTFGKTKELAEKQEEYGQAMIGVHEEDRYIRLSFNLVGLKEVYNAMFLDCKVHPSGYRKMTKQEWSRAVFNHEQVILDLSH